MSSNGSTKPRPITFAHRRLTTVRVTRPFCGLVISSASRFSRSARGAFSSITPSCG
jgi:hypothetical protein